MRKRNITEKFIKQVKEMQVSRKEIDEFCLRFLNNFFSHTVLFHQLIKNDTGNQFINTAICHNIISIVGCWETFFRDSFIVLSSSNAIFRCDIQRMLKLSAEKVTELEESNMLIDYLSQSFNFQNLNDMEEAFSPIFNKKVLILLGELVFPLLEFDGEIINDFSFKNIFPDYLKQLELLFEERHRLTHDANYRTRYDVVTLRKVENLIVVLPQLFTICLNKLPLPRMMMHCDQGEIPYVFSINDIIADDWFVVE